MYHAKKKEFMTRYCLHSERQFLFKYRCSVGYGKDFDANVFDKPNLHKAQFVVCDHPEEKQWNEDINSNYDYVREYRGYKSI